MNLLLSNDDGIDGEGLLVLASALIKAGHTVTVVAPDCNNSGVSHKVNLHTSVSLCDRSKDFPFRAYTISGTPADCIMFALGELNIKPHAILSGINNGMNLGSDCMYSGTVGAAQEGAQNRIPSLALSTNFHCEKEDFERAADIVVDKIAEWYEYAKQATGAININIPIKGEIKGIRFCQTARHDYDSRYEKNDDGSFRIRISSGAKVKEDKESDYYLFHEGYITITPLTLDMTDRTLLKAWCR